MKHFYIFLFCLLITQVGQSQSASRKVISTLGGSYQDSNFSATFTVGETIISTLSSGNIISTQGFQQPPCFNDSSSFSATVVDSYIWNGSSYTMSGTYTHTYLNAGGCDSVVTLNLIVYHTTVTMILQNVVQISPSIFEYDVMLTNTGNTNLALKGYTCGINHATGMRGGGTLTHTFISRDPSLSTIPAVVPGYTPSNNHLRFITANAGSGNEVTLLPNVTIRIATMRVTNTVPFPTDFIPDFTLQTLTAIGKTQCIANCIVTPPGTSYNINGTNNSVAAGTIQGLTGVVNTPCLFLNQTTGFISSVTQTTPATCYGQSNGIAQISLSGNGSLNPVGIYKVDGGAGIPFSAKLLTVSNLSAGTHNFEVNTNYGCTSLNVINITQPTIISTNSSLTTCNSYTWEGTTYTSSGTPTHTYSSFSGCDSLHTLNLTINNSNVGSSSLIVCNSYNWNGMTYSMSGVYTQTFTNTAGCDSVHSLNLVINQSATSLTTIGSCDSYSWNGTTYTTSGTYFQSFTNTVGCDSIASLFLTINSIHIQQNDTTICAGTSITMHATSITSTANNLPSNLQNGLVAWYPFNGNANDESGNGNHGIVNGALLTTDRFGNSNSSFSFNGINSYISTNFLPPTGANPRTVSCWLKYSTLITICDADMFALSYGSNSSSCAQAGGNFGVDINYYLGSPAHVTIDGVCTTVYQDFSVSSINSDWHQVTATFDPSWGNTFSTVKLYVDGQLLPSLSYNGNTLVNTLSNAFLTIGKGSYSSCPRFFNGEIDDIGIWNKALSSQEIQQLYSGTIVYNWSTGDTTSTIIVTPTQTTTYYLTADNGSNSCMDSITVTVSHPQVNAGAYQSICLGDSVTLVATGATSYQWSNLLLNGQSFVPSSTQTYSVTGTDSLGCTATSQVMVTVNPRPIPYVNPTGPTTFCDGNSVVLNANSSNSLTYQWFKEGIEIPGAASSSLLVSQSGSYTVEETNLNTCSSLSTPQIVTVNSCHVDLHLKLFYQGYYIGSSSMPPVLLNQGVSTDNSITDTILIELHSPLPPYGLALSKQAIIHTNGNAVCTFNYINGNYYLTDSYYVAIKHRNGLTTWSSNPILFDSTAVSYDFSTASSQAYGDNMIVVEPGIWAFYSGELNYDDNIDLLDLSILEADVSSFQFGYFASDLNGDGNVDLLDNASLESNIFNFVFSYQPSWTGSLPTVTTSTVSSIAGGSAVCGGIVTSDGGSSIVARGVCWSINPHPTTSDSMTTDGASIGSFTSNLTSLYPNTTYYVRAYVANEVGTVYGNEVSFQSATIPLTIGQSYQGGKVAYIFQPGDNGYVVGEVHGIIAAPYDQGFASWGCYGTSILGATGIALGTGNSNTIAIVSNCTSTGIAAQICNDLVLNGYNDWYLPSKSELLELYQVRASIGGFAYNYYWTSTQSDSYYSWELNFMDGLFYTYPKSGAPLVRAVRSF